MHAPANSTATPNGVFVYAPAPTFPGSTFNSNNYWVHPVLLTASTVVAPTLSSVAVTAGSTSLNKGGVGGADREGYVLGRHHAGRDGAGDLDVVQPGGGDRQLVGHGHRGGAGSTTITASVGA